MTAPPTVPFLQGLSSARHEAAASPSAGSSIAFRPDIEGMRAVAVLLVVGYHAGLARLVGGFIGVDVFFVLSGYLITQILVGQIDRTGGIAFKQFYARRARRLLPAAAVLLLVTLIAEIIAFSPLERIEFSLSALATALYSSNIYFLVRAVDYFALGAEGNPLLHTWSLAVEEQFYLVWPLLVLVGFRLTRSRRGLAFMLAGVSSVSFLLCVWLTHRNQPWAFFGTPARAWEFGIGGLASLVTLPSSIATRTWRGIAGWVGLGLVVASAFIVHATDAFPGYLALIPTVGTTLALVAGAASPTRGGPAPLLNSRVMQWLGAHSYSWYLWHWPVLVFALASFPAMPALGRVVCVLGSLGIAAATQAIIENPIRFHPRLLTRPGLSLALGAMLTVISAGAAWGVYRHSLVKGERYWHAVHDGSAMAGDCTADFTDTHPRLCSFGDTTSQTTVVLLGDSHATQWFPAMERMATAHSWKLVTVAKYSCPVARVPTYHRVLKRAYRECAVWREEALRAVMAMHPEFVVIGQLDHAMPQEQMSGGQLRRLTHDEWRAGFHSTLVTLDSAGVTSIVLRDTPAMGVVVPTCLSQAEHSGRAQSQCSAPRHKALNALAADAGRAAAAGLSHVHHVDLSDRICGETTCEPIRDGIVAYRDGSHLSRRFVDYLAPVFEDRVLGVMARGAQLD